MTKKLHYWEKKKIFHLITDTENPGIDFTNSGIDVTVQWSGILKIGTPNHNISLEPTL